VTNASKITFAGHPALTPALETRQTDSILLALLTRVLSGIHVLSRRWAETGNLNDNGFVIGFCEVVL
jgi:hypothetical protein